MKNEPSICQGLEVVDRQRATPRLGPPVGLTLAALGLVSLAVYWASGDPEVFVPAGTLTFVCVVLAIFAFIGEAIGQAAFRKGRSYQVFFWLSILLNPVITGLIVAVISPARVGEDRGESTPSKQCPRCAEDIRLEAKVCRFCGHEFD